MEFLRDKFTVTEAAPGLSESFFANLIEPRPAIETLVAFKDWAANTKQQMLRAQSRKNSPVAWIGIFVDEVGVALVMHFTKGVQLRTAQTVASTMTQCFEKKLKQDLWTNLHPLDEIDRRRINAWHTPMSLRPQGLGKKRARDEEEEECQIVAKRPKTMAQFLAERDESDSDGEEFTAAPVLRIQDVGSAPAQKNIDSLEFLSDVPSIWEHLAKTKATVVVTECGTRPTLTFVSCHSESRRLQLIVQAVRDEYERFGMLAVVRVAAALAKAGAIPGVDGPRSRKSEFLKRCTNALGALDASAEKDLDKLPRGDQIAIRKMLGDEEEPYQGCYTETCLNRKPEWVTPNKLMVRCGRCQAPMSFGRSWTTGRDQVKHEMDQMARKLTEDTWRFENRPNPLPSAPESWFGDD